MSNVINYDSSNQTFLCSRPLVARSEREHVHIVRKEGGETQLGIDCVRVFAWKDSAGDSFCSEKWSLDETIVDHRAVDLLATISLQYRGRQDIDETTVDHSESNSRAMAR